MQIFRVACREVRPIRWIHDIWGEILRCHFDRFWLFPDGRAAGRRKRAVFFKKPFTINEHVEFMIGAGPQLSYAAAGGATQIASEVALEWMIWPSAERKFGWFVEPTYSYSFSRGHEQSIGIATGLMIAIPSN
jgi:hypothetical protein